MGKRAPKKGSQKGSRKRSVSSAGRSQQGLPALSSLADLPAFSELTPSERQRSAFGEAAAQAARALGCDVDEMALGCVVRLDRGFPAVATADAVFRAEFSAHITKGGDSRVAVGDWVLARMPAGHDTTPALPWATGFSPACLPAMTWASSCRFFLVRAT